MTVCLTFDNMSADDGDGYRRVLDALNRHSLRVTFFVEGRNGVERPDRVRELAAAGHEVGLHGWDHEPWGTLDRDDAERRLARGVDALTSVLGRAPVGFRAPGGDPGPHTYELLTAHGFDYDASLSSETAPCRLRGGLGHVPFRWSGVDGFQYRQDGAGPADLVRVWDALLDAHAHDGFVTLIAHAQISGATPERFAALDTILARLARGDAEVLTAGAAAAGAARDDHRR
jgi:peptidoglycan/xylan/chitin deacetylase (PgdA/CDA1 family)